MRSSLYSAAALLAVAQLVSGQTHTDCDPTKKTCPDDKALGKTVTVDFTKGASSEFKSLPGTTLTYGPDGAQFIISNEKQAPTIESNWYIFFGRVEVVMKASPGIGIVSSFVLESDDLDEVDWEWLGGDTVQVQSNYYGKGDTTTYDRGGFHPVATPQSAFHTYTLDWTSDRITWAIDGNVVRTLAYADAKGGSRFPQTPMNVKIGSWDGGASTSPKGTVDWAGGYTDFSNNAAYTMVVKSVTITDGQAGAGSYSYGDMSGSWQSIKVSKGDGTSGGGVGGGGSSSSAAPSSSKASSTKASSTSTHASSSTKASSTLSSVTTKSSAAPTDATTDAPSVTPEPTTTPTQTGPTTASSSGAAHTLGANLAMVGAVVAYFAL